jgi:Ca-activated chloride channel homolog
MLWMRPWLILLIIPSVLVLGWFFSSHRRYANPWEGLCDSALLDHVVAQGTSGIHFWAYGVACIWLLIVIAMCGPSFSLKTKVYQSKQPYVLLLDLSEDMRAKDLVPARWQRARYKAQDLLQRVEGMPVGLIAFSSQPFLLSPVTFDRNTLRHLLQQATPMVMPVGGNDLASALAMGAKLIKGTGQSQGHLVVLTGKNPTAVSIKKARELFHQGIRVSALAVGTLQGGPVVDRSGRFIKDARGRLITSAINDNDFARFAKAGGGSWSLFESSNHDIDSLMVSLKTKAWLEKAKQTKHKRIHYVDCGFFLLWLLLPFCLLFFPRGVFA